jgi:hypothetical protein
MDLSRWLFVYFLGLFSDLHSDDSKLFQNVTAFYNGLTEHFQHISGIRSPIRNSDVFKGESYKL